MADLTLTFCNPITKEDEYKVPFYLSGNSTSFKWLKLLYHDIYIRKCTWNNNRFVGFPGVTQESLSKELFEQVAICEEEYPGHFDITLDFQNLSQDDFNRMHVWFEIYRGELENPHPFFINGSNRFKNAIERLNQLIHMWEKVENPNTVSGVTFDITNSTNEKLDNDDLLNFKLEHQPNTIYLSYIMRGKHLINLWRDDDLHIGEDNIRPHKYLSSDFYLNVNGIYTDQDISNFNQWFFRNENYLNSLGFYRNDPKSTIGYLKLAYTEVENLKEIIDTRQFLKQITIFNET